MYVGNLESLLFLILRKDLRNLKGLNPSTALGPDEHHPRVVKELATYILPFYFVIYQ